MDGWHNRLTLRWDELRERWGLRDLLSPLLVLLFLLLLAQLALGWYWSREPRMFAVAAPAAGNGRPGEVLLVVQARLADTLTGKPGGFLDNDMLPPGSMMDDMPAWERGVLGEVRDVSLAFRAPAWSEAQSAPQASELAEADAAFGIDPGAWGMPSAESEFRRGSAALARYSTRLAAGAGGAPAMRDVQFERWLDLVRARLDILATRLNAAQAASLRAGAPVVPGTESVPATSWSVVDDVFFEARGSAWALLHLLKAAEIDFGGQLAARHADLNLRAAIHELEATQQPLWSPVVLNGSGFGLFANHSLVLANYLHRARAEIGEVQGQLLAPPLAPVPADAAFPPDSAP